MFLVLHVCEIASIKCLKLNFLLKKQIDTLLLAAKNGDLRSISKIVGEKRCAYGE